MQLNYHPGITIQYPVLSSFISLHVLGIVTPVIVSLLYTLQSTRNIQHIKPGLALSINIIRLSIVLILLCANER